LKTPSFVPSASELGRETLIVLGGALLAALIVGQSPALRAWIKRQWGGALPPEPGQYL
jgi:hypothetical protein